MWIPFIHEFFFFHLLLEIFIFPYTIPYIYASCGIVMANRYPFANNQAIPPMDWEEYVSEIASDIMKEQSPKRLGTICILFYSSTIMCGEHFFLSL